MSRQSLKPSLQRRRRRALVLESLESRRMFDGDGNFYLGPPPDSYLDAEMAVEVSRLAWEFDEWGKSEIGHGPFIQSQDRRVSIQDGHALLVFVSNSENLESMLQELAPLEVDVVASLEDCISAWVPLASLNDLKSLTHVSLVYFEDLRSNHFVSSALVSSDLASSRQVVASQAALHANAVDWSPKLSLNLKSISQRDTELRIKSVGDSAIAQGDDVYQVEGDQVLILAVSASHSGADLVKRLVPMGATITGIDEDAVNAWVPINTLSQIGAIPELTFATAETKVVSMVGNTDSQGDSRMKTNEARSRFSLQGNGQSVGVLSDSFNRLGGASADVLSNDLSTVRVIADSVAGDAIDEGRAMLQIVHDVAPNANLLFATALGGQLNFSNNIQNLYDNGARIIVDDIIYLAEPMFMDGRVAQRVDSVTAQGATYVSAAGNYGNRSFERTGFTASNVSRDYGRGLVSLMDFDTGTGIDAFQSITVPAFQAVQIILQWQDPFRSVAPSSTGTLRDLDLLVYDAAGTNLLFASTTSQIGLDPVEILTIPAATAALTLNVAIAGFNVNGLGRMKYVITNADVTINEFGTASSTAWGHTNAAGAISVGASNALVTGNPPLVQSSSALGGVPILFNNQGIALAQPLFRQTPDIVGPDNVNNTFFGVDSAADTDVFPNFAGTSASAPHIAGLAALIRQSRPNATPAQILATLTSTAIDMAAPGVDLQTGSGFVDGLSAIYSTFTPPTAPDLLFSSDSGVSSADDYTAVSTPTFVGTAPAGSYVRLFVNGQVRNFIQLASGIANYSLNTGSALASGFYQASVTFSSSSTAAQSFSSPLLGFTIDTVAPTFGGFLDLLPSSDSGFSDSDNVTRFAPVLSASGAAPYLRLLRNGQVIADYFTNNSFLSTDTPSQQGSNLYQLFALDEAGNASSTGFSLSITYDTVSPNVSLPAVSPDPRLNSISTYNFNFSETSITGFDLSDVTLQRNSGANVLSSAQSVSIIGSSWTLSNLDPITAALGNYSLTLNTSTSGITDLAGNSLSNFGNLVESWRVISWQNPVKNVDVNGDGFVSPIDVLNVINFINAFGSGSVVGNPNLPAAPPYYDVNNDTFISPTDVLIVINYLNAGGQRSAGGGTTVDASVSIDLNATDLSGNAITKIQAGKEFFVTGSAKELNGRVLYGAYVDVLLSRGLQVVNVESLSSNANSPNRLQNLGGLSLDSTQTDNSLGLFTLRVRAIETGVASIKTQQASSKLNGAAYVAGLDKAIDSTRVKFGTLNLTVFGKIDNRQESGEESTKFELGSLI